MVDKTSLKNLNLPRTNFILSKIFILFVKEEFILEGDRYTLKDEKNKELRYQLYIKENKKKEKQMIIDVYKDDKFTHRYSYK